MKHGLKAILFLLSLYYLIITIFVTAVSLNYHEIRDDYIQALNKATWDATAVLIETRREDAANLMYEGYDKDVENLIPDYNKILDRFYNTLWLNLGLYDDITEQKAFRQNIAFKGIVANQSVSICLWSDTWMPPRPYSYYDKAGRILYNYTLGDDVQYFNYSTGAKGWDNIDNLPSPVTKFTHRQWKQMVIMDTINKAFSEVASSELSLQALNQHKGVRFMLPQMENSEDNVITSPGVFAVIDGVTIGYQAPLRTFSFAGAQMKLKE